MSNSIPRNKTAGLLGLTLAGLVLSSSAFAVNPLSQGYMVSAAHAAAEGKCGEGKCGSNESTTAKTGAKKTAEGKCGEGQCGVAAQTAKEIRGASPYVAIKDEPPPKLIVDPPLPEGLAIGVYWAQYRVENIRIENVFGEAATKVSPRVGHLHVSVDDTGWWWADASDNNTIDIAGLKKGKHKVTISLVGPNHNVFPGQVVTQEFVLTGEIAH